MRALHGESFSVFAKLDPGADGSEQFAAELRGLNLLRARAHVPTPAPIASDPVEADAGWLLLLEAIREVPAPACAPDQWRSIDRALAVGPPGAWRHTHAEPAIGHKPQAVRRLRGW